MYLTVWESNKTRLDKSIGQAFNFTPPLDQHLFFFVGTRTRTLSYQFLTTMVQKGDIGPNPTIFPCAQSAVELMGVTCI